MHNLQKIKLKIYAQPAVPKKKDYFFSGFEPSPVLVENRPLSWYNIQNSDNFHAVSTGLQVLYTVFSFEFLDARGEGARILRFHRKILALEQRKIVLKTLSCKDDCVVRYTLCMIPTSVAATAVVTTGVPLCTVGMLVVGTSNIRIVVQLTCKECLYCLITGTTDTAI